MSGLSDKKLRPFTYGHPQPLTPPAWRTSPEEQARLAEEAKTFPVTKLPYHGPRRHAHVVFRNTKFIANHGLDFADFSFARNGKKGGPMHIYRRSDNAEQWVPEFANNDKDLRLVLAQSSWNYMLKHGRVPDSFVENLGDLEQMVEKYFEQYAALKVGEAPRRRLERTDDGVAVTIIPCDENFANHRTHVITVQKAGGYIERDAAVAYQTWRLRHDSPTVGAEMGIMPSHVRRILGGLCASARSLGFEATSPRNAWCRGGVRKYRANPRFAKLPPWEELVEIVLSGKTLQEITDQFGVIPRTVRDAYQRGKPFVIQQMRESGSTWEEIEAKFSKEPAEIKVKKYRRRKQ